MGLFRRKDQVAAREFERRAERSFRQVEKEHENDRCRGAARSGHCFARAGAANQSQQGAQSGQNAGGTYQGYSTKEWQRPGSW